PRARAQPAVARPPASAAYCRHLPSARTGNVFPSTGRSSTRTSPRPSSQALSTPSFRTRLSRQRQHAVNEALECGLGLIAVKVQVAPQKLPQVDVSLGIQCRDAALALVRRQPGEPGAEHA